MIWNAFEKIVDLFMMFSLTDGWAIQPGGPIF